jgi:hypothetical protein
VKAVVLVVALVACGSDKIEVHDQGTADYNHAAFLKAVDGFVASGRTPAAYGLLAATVRGLRPGMDKAVADETELKMVVLALGPVQSIADKPMADQVDALALTVWPTLLAPRIEADALLEVRDSKAAQLAPLNGEDPHGYIERLCGGVLAGDCKHIVPEQQGDVVYALVVHRATERVRNAVSDCMTCSTEAGWHDAVVGWETLDREANTWITDITRRAAPDNWPIAGAAADDDPGLPEAEFTSRGELLYGGHSYGPNAQRIAVLRDLRGTDTVVALHIHPEMTLEQTRAILVDARKAGCARVAIIAREGVYPWRRKIYWVADGTGMRANLRPTDSLQLLLHAVDEVAGPGTVARID